MVCDEDFEQRHPQDLLRVQREQISVPWARPYPAQDTFIPQNLWTDQADALGLVEQIVKAYAKSIGTRPTDSALNGWALNSAALNFSDTSNDPDETITLSETVLITLARFFTDSVSLNETIANFPETMQYDVTPVAESLWFAEQEHSTDTLAFSELSAFEVTKTISETASLSENTSYSLSSLMSLNGAPLDTYTLG